MYQQNLANQQPYQRGGNLAYSALLGGMDLGGQQAVPTSMVHANSAGVTAAPSPAAPTGLPGWLNSTLAPSQPAQSTAGTPQSSWEVPGIGTVGVVNNGASQEEMNAANSQYAGTFTDTFAPSEAALDPSFEFRNKWGLRALESSAAARGLTGSGQNLTDIVNYGQDAASQEYQNMFNRYQTEQGNLFNRLSALAGTGQSAATNTGAAGQAAGQSIGSTLTGAANTAGGYQTGGAAASAAGSMGAANAWSSGLSDAAGWNWLSNQKK